MTFPQISVIVIGKNEAKNLSRLHQSIMQLSLNHSCETIYIDSCSTDKSVEIAVGLFDKVVVLEYSRHLNASAGRSVGCSLASGDWLLFLDGDMVLLDEGVKSISQHVKIGNFRDGLVGNYINKFDDGSESVWRPTSNKFDEAKRFGGAVMLSKEMIAIEKWNHQLYSNEEIDLYSKLMERGFKVKYSKCGFVNHYTRQIGVIKKIIGNLCPYNSYLGKKYHGFGQLIRHRVENRRLINLIRWWPDPFLFWFSVIVFAISVGLGYKLYALTFECLLLFWIARFGSLKFAVTSIFLLFQGLFGFNHKVIGWEPKVSCVYIKDRQTED